MQTLAPVQINEREKFMDVLRGFAILGIFIANLGSGFSQYSESAHATGPLLVPGWDSPTPQGQTVHDYQKAGAKFCANVGMKALIGDEMGVGKTAQAIAAAEGISARKVLVVCPPNARFVWDYEIIVHVQKQIDGDSVGIVANQRTAWHTALQGLG